jgi:STE24 endopeptidase
VTSRSAALLAVVVLTAAVASAVLLTMPSAPAADLGDGARAEVSRSFTQAEINRENRFYRQLRPWTLTSMGLSLLVALILGLTPAGARIVELAARPLGGHWAWQAALGAVALSILGRLVTLPLSARAEIVLRKYGLSTQDWPGWWADVAKSWAISGVLAVAAALVFFAVVRASPQWWWAWLAAAGAAVVFALSFLYPVLFEPIFNRFTPMESGPFREQLIEMADRDGVPVSDVLVADASRRTTALNAYVSGYGPSRRIVVYDTLLDRAPEAEVKLVVAHELAHAKYGDVLRGTAVGALGAALAVCLLYVVLGWQPLLARAGAGPEPGPTALALMLALSAIAGLISMPVQSFASRRVEARADEHALQLTRDPATFIGMQRRLAVENISDLEPPPFLYVMFASHPTGPQRIAHARDYARREGIELAEAR